MAAPSTPSNLYVQQGNGQVLLSWDLSAGATSYPIYRSTNNVTFALLGTASTNNYLDTTPVLNTQYYYRVTASNGDESVATTPQGIIPTLTGIDSLASLRLQAQQRADRVNSNFVTLPEWNMYINQSAKELYDLLITAYEDYFLAPEFTFATDGSASYQLPDGIILDVNSVLSKPFYKLMGVDISESINTPTNMRITIHKYDYIDRNRYIYPQITSTFAGVFNLRYRVMGSKLTLIPTPSSGQYITLHYIPKLPILLRDTDTLDSISGWSEYVIVDAAIKALQKEESDVSVLMAEKQMLKQRIEESASNRDAGQPDTISNTRGYGGRGSTGGFGYDGSSGGF